MRYIYPDTNAIINEDLRYIVSSELNWQDLSNKTIMVSGGGGFLAAYLIKALLTVNRLYKLDFKVICVVRNIESANSRLSAYINSPDFSIVKHDIARPLPHDFPKADLIVHCASQASPRYYGIDPVGTLLANSVGTMYLLEHAVKCQAHRFMFFSSGEVYGKPTNPEKLVREQDLGYLDPMSVRSCYAESKRMGETMCVAWAQQYNLHTTVVRPFHTYGPGMTLNDGRVFSDFVADVVAQRDIVLKSDGMVMRPFCYIADATIGFLTVLLNGSMAEVYNIGNPNAEIFIKDLAIKIAGLFPERRINTRFDIPVESNAYLKSPVSRCSPSIEKIHKLGWAPTMGLNQGFKRTVESFL